MYIPDELLKHDLDGKSSVDIPSCPVLVFVDIKNEKLGGRLYNEFCCRLNKKKVFVVLEEDSDSKIPIKIEEPEGVLKENTPKKSKSQTTYLHHFQLGCNNEWLAKNERWPICGRSTRP